MRLPIIFFMVAITVAPVIAQDSLTESTDYPNLLPGPTMVHPGTGCYMLASGSIEPGDVDWVQITLPFANAETVVDVDFAANSGVSMLLVSEVGGSSVFGNGDGNSDIDNQCGLGGTSSELGSTSDSAVILTDTLENAVLNIAITGGGDWGFTGAHSQKFTYEVWVSAFTDTADGGCSDNSDCNDDVSCTEDVCDTSSGECTHTADDSLCDNGMFCDGVRVCDVEFDCQAGETPCEAGEVCSEEDDGGVCVAPTGIVMDIKPGSCPNQLNRRSRGVLPVVLLGSSDFDVSQVDIFTLVMTRADGVGGSVSPHEGPPGPHTTISDVATPGASGDESEEDCACNDNLAEEDGLDDLNMKFKTIEVVEMLELDQSEHAETIELVIHGLMLDGSNFSASDCIRVMPMKSRSMHGQFDGRHIRR